MSLVFEELYLVLVAYMMLHIIYFFTKKINYPIANSTIAKYDRIIVYLQRFIVLIWRSFVLLD